MQRILTPEESIDYECCGQCRDKIEEALCEELAENPPDEPCVVMLDTGEILFALTPFSTEGNDDGD